MSIILMNKLNKCSKKSISVNIKEIEQQGVGESVSYHRMIEYRSTGS